MLYGKITKQLISVLIGCFLIIVTDIVDDINFVPAKYKFLCQTAVATVVVVYSKLYFTNITLLGLNLIFPTWINMILSLIMLGNTLVFLFHLKHL